MLQSEASMNICLGEQRHLVDEEESPREPESQIQQP